MVIADDAYRNDVDFTALAMQFAGFAKKLKPNGQLDFSDPESVRQLTKALLQRDFNLTIDLPEDRLCPPVPNRFNYIVFIQKLVDSTRFDFRTGSSSNERVLALDIGTGASAIYPLLACRQRPNWYFVATEIDSKSHTYAERNIKANGLQSRVKLVKRVPEDEEILPWREYEGYEDYTIKIMLTNPPFYSSTQDLLTSAANKSRPPNSACTGAPVEMITPGGETTFIMRIITESALAQNRSKILWFSSMLGKFSSVGVTLATLKERGCTNYAVEEFVQGRQTRRWCVAWSWAGMRPPVGIARGIEREREREYNHHNDTTTGLISATVEKNLLPFPSEYEIDLSSNRVHQISSNLTSTPALNTEVNSNADTLLEFITTHISPLDLIWNISHDTKTGLGRSEQGDVWSRKARRRKLQQQQQQQQQQDQGGREGESSMDAENPDQEMKDVMDRNGGDDDDMIDDRNKGDESESDGESEGEAMYRHIPFAFRIAVQPRGLASSARDKQGTGCVVHVRWLQGHDSVLFESFCGWLKRKMETRPR